MLTCYYMLHKLARHLMIKLRSFMRPMNKIKKLPESTKIEKKKNRIQRRKTILPHHWTFVLSATLGLRKSGMILNLCLRIRSHKGNISISIPLGKIVKNYTISIFTLVFKLLLYLISIIASLF